MCVGRGPGSPRNLTGMGGCLTGIVTETWYFFIKIKNTKTNNRTKFNQTPPFLYIKLKLW